MLEPYVIGIIAVAYGFDFMNGFHDAANSISTVVSTRVLSPLAAVSFAAVFNFIAFLVFGVAVAKTIGAGLVRPGVVDQYVVLAALVGALFWGIITWLAGLPTSSSHALIGGLVGAAITKAGVGALLFTGLNTTVIFMVVSPLIGFFVAFTIMVVMIRLFFRRSSHTINRYFRRLQLVSSSLVSLSHGTNDAQKTMGVVTALLVSTGNLSSFVVPLWVVLMAHSAIALGTFFGGWRIVRTLGFRMTKLDPVHGFSIETAAAATIIASSLGGIPVSTTHVVSGGVLGSGITMGASMVKWGIARRIIWAWLITIPASALVASVVYVSISLVHG
ncbi:MAG: inorganic phosphate transporter [Nitrososphaerales archaeon]|nr:inorganic phosphate transporter [Nitrososphaerales archaeon]